MFDELSGFVLVGFGIIVGYFTARANILPENSRTVMNKLAFYICTPMLLFTVLGLADTSELFTDLLPISAIAAASVFVIFLIATYLRKQPFGTGIIGALSSGYVSANTIGIPISIFMLGNAVYSAPVMLLQLIFWAPLSLTLLDQWRSEKAQVHLTLLRTLKNPVIIGSLLGVLIDLTNVQMPPILWDATGMIGRASVPLLLISFGMSLHGNKFMQDKAERFSIVMASSLKLIVMPLIAWALAFFVFQLDAQDVYAVTILAALPTAQNVLNYANEYETGKLLARDVTFITTFGAIPVLLLITVLLAR